MVTFLPENSSMEVKYNNFKPFMLCNSQSICIPTFIKISPEAETIRKKQARNLRYNGINSSHHYEATYGHW
jgi:hypothetical protein